MQRPGTEAIRTQLQPSKPKREIINKGIGLQRLSLTSEDGS